MNHHIESDLIYFLFFEPLICFDPFSSSMKAAFYFNLFAFIFSSAPASCAFSSSDESILAEQDQFNTPARAKKGRIICYRHLENPVMFFLPPFLFDLEKKEKSEKLFSILFRVYYTHCKKKI
jgi:hypothetical protein